MSNPFDARDFIVNTLSPDKKESFLADVNELLREIGASPAFRSEDEKTKDWVLFRAALGDDKILEFGEKWYGQKGRMFYFPTACFALRVMFEAKRLGYCVRDGKLY